MFDDFKISNHNIYSSASNPIDIFLKRHHYRRNNLCVEYGLYRSTMTRVVRKDIRVINAKYIYYLAKLTGLTPGKVFNDLLTIQGKLLKKLKR